MDKQTLISYIAAERIRGVLDADIKAELLAKGWEENLVNETLSGKETSSIHHFELAGLGKAPFHFTGTVTEKVFVACPGATPKAGSSCDYCGTGIRYEFWVRSACGKEFKVGCDCIHKTGDRGLIQQISAAERKLRDAKNKAAKITSASGRCRLISLIDVFP
jgi:hypothetical protein